MVIIYHYHYHHQNLEEDQKERFNPPSKENLEGLNPNIVVLVNILIGANLRINHVKRELNYIKLIEFMKMEVKNPNKWLE